MHQTVREFFRFNGPTAQTCFRMKSSDAHRAILVTCIRYLMLCTAKAVSISQTAGGAGKAWATRHYEAYAKYLSTRPFINYAIEYAERHRARCGQGAGDSELISQLHTKLGGSPVASIFKLRIPGHEQQDSGKDFRAALLHAATRMKCPQVVEALLIAGAEVDANEDGKTPLIVTAEIGDLATARVLLNRGAFIEAKDGKGQTALHLAATNGHDPVAGLLIDRGADMEARDEKDQTPLHLAAVKGHEPAAGLLIDRGADKEAEDREDQTALHLAAANGHNPVIELLVDRGANKNAKDVFGWGLLHTAAWNNHDATIQMLVQTLNANKEERDLSGWTALHVAAMNGCDTAIRCLIKNLEADREAKDDTGWTALHFVAALGLGETAELLIETFGVDRGTRNNEKETSKDLAQRL